MTWRFSAWCPLKSHIYLNLQLKAAVLVGYVLPFNEHQTWKVKIKIHKNTAIRRQPPEVFNKKGFLKISQNSLENACARASFLKKRRLWHKCFPVNFAKFLRIPFLQNTSGGLRGLLNLLHNFDLSWFLSLVSFRHEKIIIITDLFCL